jgi:hypothetical protein
MVFGDPCESVVRPGVSAYRLRTIVLEFHDRENTVIQEGCSVPVVGNIVGKNLNFSFRLVLGTSVRQKVSLRKDIASFQDNHALIPTIPLPYFIPHIDITTKDIIDAF